MKTYKYDEHGIILIENPKSSIEILDYQLAILAEMFKNSGLSVEEAAKSIEKFAKCYDKI